MNCPFCGVVADAPHETQGACIEALNAEIGRMRTLLHQVRPPEAVTSHQSATEDTVDSSRSRV